MRVLLYGEGSGDVGEHIWNATRRRDEFIEGWLQPLMRKLVGPHVEFIAYRRSDIILLPRDRRRHRPLPRGHGAKALAAKYRALTEACECLVFMADADTVSVGEWRAKVSDIENGFDATEVAVAGVACVPLAASECWLLSDGRAWELVAGNLPNGFPRRGLERLWGGRNDPDGNHPHRIFHRMCERAGLVDGRETRRLLAEAIDPGMLTAQCPVSWSYFSNAAQAAVATST